MTNDVINHIYVTDPPQKSYTEGLRDPPALWLHPPARRVAHPNSTGAQPPGLRTLPDLILCILSCGRLFICILYKVLYNKPVVEVKHFLELCELFSKLSNRRRESWEPQFVAKAHGWETLRTHYL